MDDNTEFAKILTFYYDTVVKTNKIEGEIEKVEKQGDILFIKYKTGNIFKLEWSKQ